MIRLTPTHMKIIFNRCNAIFFILHLFLNTSFLYVIICLILIAGCWTKMVDSAMREEHPQDGGGDTARRLRPAAGRCRCNAAGR
jgi:hypothetical protein